MASIGAVNFGGLASGIDTQKLMEDLIKVDSIPLTRLESRQAELSKKSTTFKPVFFLFTSLFDRLFLD